MIAEVLVGTVCRCPWLSRQVPKKEVTLTLDVMEILRCGFSRDPRKTRVTKIHGKRSSASGDSRKS